MSTRRSLLAAGLSATLAAGALTAWLVERSNSTAGSPDLANSRLVTNPFTTTVSVANGTEAGAGSMLRVRVAASKPMRTVTLYDGSRPVGSARPARGEAAVRFDVPAADLGTHAFTAHVISAGGVAASSQPDPVVVARRRGQTQAYFPALVHETTTGAAHRLGVPANLVKVVGHTVMETLPRAPLSPIAPAASSTLLGSHPELAASVSGCTVHVTSVLHTTVEVERSSATDGGYVAAGTVSAGHPLDLTDVPGGQLLLQGRVHGELTAVTSAVLPDSCDPGAWTGTVSIRHGLLLLPHPAAAVYLYLGADASRFARAPADPTENLVAAARVTPIGFYLPSLPGHHLVVEAWVPPDAGSAHARLLGRGELTVPDSSSIDEAIGVRSSIRLEHEGGTDADGSVTIHPGTEDAGFVVRTDSSAPDHIAWQILQHPLTPANHDVNPYGLLKLGEAPISKNYATFHLDARHIPHGVPRTNNTVYVRVIAFSGQNELGLVSSVLVLHLRPLPQLPPGPIYLGSHPSITALHVNFPHKPNPALANCIRITHVPDESGGVEDLLAHTFYPTPGTYCYDDYDHDDDCGDWFSCAIDAVGSVVEGAVEAFAELWDLVSGFYNDVVSDIVDAIASLASPFCKLAGSIDASAQDDCNTVAQLVSSAAVDAVLTSFGLPTHLPSSAEVAQLAKGDLTVIGTELLQQAGVPCDQLQLDSATAANVRGVAEDLDVSVPKDDGLCQALIDEILSKKADQITAAARSGLLEEDGLPDLISSVPGYTYTAEPKGQAQPIAVRVDSTGAWAGKPFHYACPIAFSAQPHYGSFGLPPFVDVKNPLRSVHGVGKTVGPWYSSVGIPPNPDNSLWSEGFPGTVTVTVTPDPVCMNGGPRHVTGSLRPYLER